MLRSKNQLERREFLAVLTPLCFWVLHIAMAGFIVAFPLFSYAAEIEIVRKAPDTIQPVLVIKQSSSRDGKAATVLLNAPYGIFSLDVDLAKLNFEKVTFVIKNAKTWEGVSFKPTDAHREPVKPESPVAEKAEHAEPIDLKEAPDVQIKARKGDCVIEFGPEAIKLLKRGGRFQFIDAYRG